MKENENQNANRTLATLQKITDIQSIVNADKIELATVLGWQVVVKKDEFKVGDLVIYIETDSIVPEREEFEFLRERKFRVRAIKLRGIISQGLIMPITILPSKIEIEKLFEGCDVSNLLGITKYDPEGDKERKLLQERENFEKNKIKKYLLRFPWYRRLIFKPKKSRFPNFIAKTDETRLQKIPGILEKYKNEEFFVTEKLDGQSGTFCVIKKENKLADFFKFILGKKLKGHEFIVCSRNLQLGKKDDSNYWKIAEKFEIEKKLVGLMKKYGTKFVVLQGEIIGEGIQGNKYGTKGLDFYVFNLIINGENVIEENGIRGMLEEMGIKVVPLIEEVILKNKGEVKDFIEFAKGKSVLNGKVLREGIVFRCYNGKNILSFKVINEDFLIKWEE
jgi:hypothetical protein